MFSTKTYVTRRQKLKKQIDSGLVLLLGNDESPINFENNTFDFRQDSTFLYYYGLDFPGLAGVVDVDEDDETIFGEELTLDDVIWMGNQPTRAELAMQAGVEKTAPLSRLEEIVQEALRKNRKIHFLPPYRPEHKIKLFTLLGIPFDEAKEKASVELILAVSEQRNVKSQEEIQEIEKAVNLSVDMHLTAMHMIRPGIKEAQVVAEVMRTAVAGGGRSAFSIIATKDGQRLHNHYHGNTLNSGDLFLLDAGAETPLGYAGDLSSTIPVDNKFTKRQKEIYQVALSAQEAAIAAFKPGVKHLDIHLLACKTIAQQMKDLGFMKGDVDEAVAQGAHALFFPCGVGHLMGLDVHDMESLGEVHVGYAGAPKSTQFGLKSLRLGRELKPGYVITVEPGVYFIPELIDHWRSEKKFVDFLNYDKIEQYKDFGGCRNEENYLITQTGTRVLGKPLPKTVEAIEAQRIMHQAAYESIPHHLLTPSPQSPHPPNIPHQPIRKRSRPS